ncbi:MAG: helix-turn-helix domain-containing protein [Methanomassiliicoccaceae archaeon]|nr:helix-turn-helix domain-containing protein [Methanomassiliicoccaceae archaeon]
MNDIDTILSVIENPTRRRILEALVREPHYPLQLSRELGVSQQAVMKNLDVLERGGLVEGRREASDRGPLKTVYRPTSEFTLTIDLRSGMFRATLSEPGGGGGGQDGRDMALGEVRESLSEIDRRIGEFDRLREEMVERRDAMIRSFMGGAFADGLDYIGRSMLYGMLNSPGHDVTEVSRDMGVREDRMAKVIEEIECRCKEIKEGKRDEQ